MTVKHLIRPLLCASVLTLAPLSVAMAAPMHQAPAWQDAPFTLLYQWAQQAADLAAQAPSPVIYALLLCGLGLMDARTRTRR